ncbi:MAG: hypothetical protein AAFW47_06475 [Pseudomonadota bacterium]
MTGKFMKRCLLASAGAATLLLSGCSVWWPEHGHGGFAEHRMGLPGSLAHDRFDERRDSRLVGRHNPLGIRHFGPILQDGYSHRGRVGEARYVHDFAIISFDERVQYLKARGAERCAPGDLAKAELILNRVKRQWVSDLYGDALIDMERLEYRLDRVDERIFNGHCQHTQIIEHHPAPAKKKVFKKPVYDLGPAVQK